MSTQSHVTTRRLLMAAAMAGLAVSIYSQASWYGLWLGSAVAGLGLALAIDCGIFAAMRAAFDGDDRALWVVGGLAAVSWLANAQHAAMVHAGRALDFAGWQALDPLTGGNAVLTAGIAPVAAVALAWLGHRAGARDAQPAPDAAAMLPAMLAQALAGPPIADPQPAAQAPRITREEARAVVQGGGLPAGFASQAELARYLGVDPSRVSEWARTAKKASANGSGGGVTHG